MSLTLARNRDEVDRVARGEQDDAFVTAMFSSITGREFYRDVSVNPLRRLLVGEPIRQRVTYGVGVYIVHDPSMPQGYLVVTAYPRVD